MYAMAAGTANSTGTVQQMRQPVFNPLCVFSCVLVIIFQWLAHADCMLNMLCVKSRMMGQHW